jgi:hypothetical protein
MNNLDNLFLIAGNGRNSGKTTMACRVTKQFSHLGIISLKVSPHFHEPSSGLIPISKNTGYAVYEETDRGGSKDTSRMLRCGAKKVFYAQVLEGYLGEAFNEVMKNIPEGSPIVCESPSLINYREPGIFVIMIGEKENYDKDISKMLLVPHLEYTLSTLSETEELPFSFVNGRWTNAY